MMTLDHEHVSHHLGVLRVSLGRFPDLMHVCWAPEGVPGGAGLLHGESP